MSPGSPALVLKSRPTQVHPSPPLLLGPGSQLHLFGHEPIPYSEADRWRLSLNGEWELTAPLGDGQLQLPLLSMTAVPFHLTHTDLATTSLGSVPQTLAHCSWTSGKQGGSGKGHQHVRDRSAASQRASPTHLLLEQRRMFCPRSLLGTECCHTRNGRKRQPRADSHRVSEQNPKSSSS